MISREQVPPIKVEVSGSGYVRWPEGKKPVEEPKK
jgi:hypothetical protein